MRRIKKIGLLGKILFSAVLLIVGLSLIWFILPRHSENILNKEPELFINAQNLIAKLERGTSENFDLVPEKVVEITGEIKDINELNNRLTIILGRSDKEHPSIICDMAKNQKDYIKGLSVNDTIVIKGIYKGFLKDAIFLNCIVVYE
ncbi:OB-fold protein [Flagellimonas sp.]|uniref:OB-fold protein n=1 Tax=Flagellimonas sp. TaxID=2058762 RepID=UPI003B5CB433